MSDTMSDGTDLGFGVSDRTALIDFMVAVRDILQQVVEWRGLLFAKELRQPIADAWLEVQSAFDDVDVRLRSVEGDEIVSDDELAKIGLTGKQLELKLKGFNSTWGRFKQWGTVKALKKLLDWIDIILGSLASIIPGADAIEEFKDSAKQAIEDG